MKNVLLHGKHFFFFNSHLTFYIKLQLLYYYRCDMDKCVTIMNQRGAFDGGIIVRYRNNYFRATASANTNKTQYWTRRMLNMQTQWTHKTVAKQRKYSQRQWSTNDARETCPSRWRKTRTIWTCLRRSVFSVRSPRYRERHNSSR